MEYAFFENLIKMKEFRSDGTLKDLDKEENREVNNLNEKERLTYN